MKDFGICLSLALLSITVVGCTHRPMVVAHRGYSGLAPENTLASVNAAWNIDADAVEIDVHLSKDNKIVVIHDANTRRTSGKDFVVNETYFNTLATLDVGSFKCEEFSGETIPLLEDVIQTIPFGKYLFIEIKSGSVIVPHLAEVIRNSGRESSVSIIAFNPDVLEQAKKQMPKISVYWLLSPIRDKQTDEVLPYNKSLIDAAKARGFDGLNVQFVPLTESYVDMVHKEGLKLFVWTVNDMANIQMLADMGVDGITTDYPCMALEEMHKQRIKR